MKPKTQREREVLALSATLPPMTQHMRDTMLKRVFRGIATKRNDFSFRYTCMECGEHFAYAEEHSYRSGGRTYKKVTCPHCGKELKVIVQDRNSIHHSGYYCFVTTCKQYTVLRYFTADKYGKSGQHAYFEDPFEISQIWITEGGVKTVVGRRMRMFSYNYVQPWNKFSAMEIRKPGESIGGYDTFSYYTPFCDWSILSKPKYMRRLTLQSKGTDDPCSYIRSRCMVECQTLLQCGREDLMRGDIRKLRKFWPSIRIALRNNYRPCDVKMWYDMLDAMDTLGMDLHQPKYICTDTLKQLHDTLVKRVEKREEALRHKREREQLLARLENEQEELKKFYEVKGRYFDIDLKGDGFHIFALRTPEEHLEEGQQMHHCVGSMGYWKRFNSLIMVARTYDDKRIATIEINLTTLEIVQVRGVCNEVPEHDKEIRKLIRSHRAEFQVRQFMKIADKIRVA